MKIIRLLIVPIAFVLTFPIPSFGAAAKSQPSADGVKPFFIKVRETKLRQTASYFAPASGTVRYGDEVTPVNAGDSQWVEVKTKTAKGFVHISSLSDKKILLSSSKKSFSDSGYDSSEVVLAGKGFNAEVEKSYAAADSSLRFDAVNELDRVKISEPELRSFLNDGGLSQPKG